MKTPDLSLIQSALTKAARSEASAATAARTSGASGDEFTATVTASRRARDSGRSASKSPDPRTTEPRTTDSRNADSRATDSRTADARPGNERSSENKSSGSQGNWQITVTSEGKSLNLQSTQPLPVGAEVSLRVTEQSPPRVVITDIRLPQSSASQAPANASLASQLQSMAQQLQQTAAQQLAAANNNLSSQNSGTPVSSLTGAMIPDAIKALLMARVGWSQPATLSSAPSSSALSSPVNSTPAAGLQSMAVSSGSSVSTAKSATGATLSTAATPDYSAVLRAVLSDLSATAPKELRQTSLLQPVQALVKNLPDAAQLSSPTGLHRAISNSPLNYESQLFRIAAAAAERPSVPVSREASTPSSSVASVFKSLWNKAAAHTTADIASPRPEGPVSTQGASGVSVRTASNEATDMPLRTKSSLLSAIEALQKQLSGQSSTATGTAAAETTTAQWVALLGAISANAAPQNALSTATNIPGDNLKGLLLFILGRTQSNAANAADANAGTSSTAATRPGAINEGLRPETFRLLQAALAQTESEQVRLVQTQDTTQFQIPLMWRDNDTVRQDLLCMKRDEDGNTSYDDQTKKSRWQITLHFDLETLGPLDIELDLSPPAVSATFWSETSDTLSEIQQALRPLRDTLTALGADVGELRARHGRKHPGEQPVIRHSLVDIHT
mgnify:FL=1